MQSGQANIPEAAGVEMLASVYYQPLWILTRRGQQIDSLAALKANQCRPECQAWE